MNKTEGVACTTTKRYFDRRVSFQSCCCEGLVLNRQVIMSPARKVGRRLKLGPAGRLSFRDCISSSLILVTISQAFFASCARSQGVGNNSNSASQYTPGCIFWAIPYCDPKNLTAGVSPGTLRENGELLSQFTAPANVRGQSPTDKQ